MSLLPTFIEQGLAPDIFEEKTAPGVGADELTYVAYLKNGDTTKAMIKEIKKVGDVTTVKYPNGRADFVHDWASRTIHNYEFRK